MSDDKQRSIYTQVLTDVGGRRTNEDAVYACDAVETEKIQQRGHLYIVADGTGGQKGGQTASSMAAEIIAEHFYDDSSKDIDAALKSAVETAHEALHQLAQRISAWAEMSTTIVAAVIYQGELHVAHVGDSRAYLIRDGQARLITRDHVWLEDDDNYGSLTRWLGGNRASVDVEVSVKALQDGDKLLLCSDGLTNVVDSQDIQAYVSKLPPSQAAQTLIDLADRRGTSDNVSTAVIQYGGEVPKSVGSSRVAWYAGGGAVAVIALLVLFLGGVFGGDEGGDMVTSTPVVVETEENQQSTREEGVIATPTAEEGSLEKSEPTATEEVDTTEKRATSTPIPATDTPTPRPTSPPPPPTATFTPAPPTPTSASPETTEPPPPPPTQPPDDNDNPDR